MLAPHRRDLFLLPFTLLVTARHAPAAQVQSLGTVRFPTSASSSDAQARFERGVAALHSFWYPVALEEFRAARRLEPGFTMALWGEAMAHNHPVWGDPQDTEAARRVLASLPDGPVPGITPREQGYIDAVRALYGPGDKPARDRAHAEAMARLSAQHPDDLEAAAFHALALLGLAYGGGGAEPGAPRAGEGLRLRMRAGAVAQEVWRREPEHPGAAHYILHAFDPDHAVLALPAARRYAEIAPVAPHALHMPSHIFLQLGMWPETVASNEAAWRASRDAGAPDAHSLHWLLYGRLQQGHAEQARPLLDAVREVLLAMPRDDTRGRVYGAYIQAMMTASFLLEMRRWEEADRILPPQETGASQPAPGGGGGNPYQAFEAMAGAPAAFGRGTAAAWTGETEAVRRQVSALEALGRHAASAPVPFVASMAPVMEIQAMEITAAAQAARGDTDAATETMRRATALEEQMPVPPGPPPLIKPSHELLGEILLRAGRREEAAAQFATALLRHPGRALSARGLEEARGGAKTGGGR